MISKLSTSILRSAGVASLAFAMFSGCQQDPSSSTPPGAPLPLGSAKNTAHTALVWLGARIINNVQYSAIWMADSDFTHEAVGMLSPISTATVAYLYQPNWSPSGSSVCVSQLGIASSAPDSIKAFDVSVDHSGNPVGSNVRTILGMANQNIRLNNCYWSSTTTVGKIAYTTRDGASSYNTNDGSSNSLYVVGQTGGTPQLIYTASRSIYASLGFPTWNADDSRLAVARADTGGATSKILIYNTSNWSCVDSINISGTVLGMEWSHGSLNKLCFGARAAGSTRSYLYYCTPSTGSTASTYGVEGQCPSWSPNNSSVLYDNGYASSMNRNVPMSATTSTFLSTFSGGGGMQWKP